MGRNLSLLLGVLLVLCIGTAVAQVPAGCDCTDNAPDDEFTCEQQSDFGKCSESWMISGNLCEYTCGVCSCDDDESEDAAPEEPEATVSEDEDEDEEDAEADEEDAEADEEDAEADAEVDEEEAEVDEEEAEAVAEEEVEADEEEAEADEEDAEEDEEGPVITLGDGDEEAEEDVVEAEADEEEAEADEEDAEAEEDDAALADDETEDTATVGVILPSLTGDEDEESAAEEEEDPEAVEDDPALVEEDEEAAAEDDPVALEEEAVVEEDPSVVVSPPVVVGPSVVVGDEEAVVEEDPPVVEEVSAVVVSPPVVVGDEEPVVEDPAVAEEAAAVIGDEETVVEEDPAVVEGEEVVVEDEAVDEEAAVEEETVDEETAVEEEEAVAEEDTAEEDEEPTGDERPLEEFADPDATCGVSLYEALNTGDETGAFATLLAAAGLDTDLGSEKDSYTVFAPTNEAVEDGVGALGISVDELLSSPKGETIAKYHVVEGLLEPAKLKQPKQIETVGGEPLIGGSVREIEGLGSTAKIVGDPIPICNSLVYVVDSVLLPASDLAGISPVDIAPAPEDEEVDEAACEEGFDGFFAISEDEELSILAEMLNTFALSADLADGSVEYTIFAPTNDAFQKAAKTLETTVDDMLKDETTAGILNYHIIDSILVGKDLLKEKSTELKSRNGTDIVMETNSKGTVAELFGVGSSAKVIDTDIDKSCTAAVHKVNNVLLPFRAAASGTGVRGISSPSKAAASSGSAPAPTTKKASKGSGECQVGTQSLFEVLSQIPEIKVFSSIVRQAKLARVFTNKSLKVTVFAPVDFAFGNILPRGKGFFDLVPDVVLAENLVSNHIVGKPLPARLLKDGLKMKTALTKKGKRETLELLEDPLVFPTGLSVEAPESTANITKLDIFACNSVIHLVDAVLLADLEVIPSKSVTVNKALEASESYGSLLNPRSEDDDDATSG